MTFVGKILVIVIMVFALLFLGISTVVFTTHTNWKEATSKEKEKVTKANAEIQALKAQLEGAKKDLDRAKADHATQITLKENDIKKLTDENQTFSNDVAMTRGKLEVAQESAKTALTEAAADRAATDQLRALKAEVDKQSNEYKLQQTELNDKIREQERQIQTIDENNKDLRDRVARYSTLLRKNGLSDDISTVKGLESPPIVQGEVARIDAKNTQMEITLGSNDGIVAGHELFLFRTKPQAQYLGKVKILSTDPNQAVAKVIGRTVNGIKIKEGDIVSSTIRPRS